MEARLNLNDTIWVELNENGWKLLEEHYKELFSVPVGADTKEQIEKSVNLHKSRTNSIYIDGQVREITEFILHEFINIFGKDIHIGADPCIVGNKIYLTID